MKNTTSVFIQTAQMEYLKEERTEKTTINLLHNYYIRTFYNPFKLISKRGWLK
jgi:hypothetical protein